MITDFTHFRLKPWFCCTCYWARVDALSSALILLKNIFFKPKEMSPKLLFCLLTSLFNWRFPEIFLGFGRIRSKRQFLFVLWIESRWNQTKLLLVATHWRSRYTRNCLITSWRVSTDVFHSVRVTHQHLLGSWISQDLVRMRVAHSWWGCIFTVYYVCSTFMVRLYIHNVSICAVHSWWGCILTVHVYVCGTVIMGLYMNSLCVWVCILTVYVCVAHSGGMYIQSASICLAHSSQGFILTVYVYVWHIHSRVIHSHCMYVFGIFMVNFCIHSVGVWDIYGRVIYWQCGAVAFLLGCWIKPRGISPILLDDRSIKGGIIN